MTKREMIKPFSWGLVTGAIAITVAAFSAGWVVTSGSKDQQVRAAWIDGQAKVCASLVQTHRQAAGDVTDLSGYRARGVRDEFAKSFAVVLPGQEAVDPSVIKSCADMLNKRNT